MANPNSRLHARTNQRELIYKTRVSSGRQHGELATPTDPRQGRRDVSGRPVQFVKELSHILNQTACRRCVATILRVLPIAPAIRNECLDTIFLAPATLFL